MAELVTRVGGKLQFNLHPGQTAAWESSARVILVLAGSQGGKTSFGPLWLWREYTLRGPGDYLAATATYDLFKLKMLPEMLRFFRDNLGWEYRAGDGVIETPNKDTRLILRSAQSEGGLESATAQAAWCDEWGQDAVSVTAQEAIERRLALHQGRQLITTTPYSLGWMYQRIYSRALAGDPDYALIQFRSIDNPSFPRESYERARAVMPAWRHAMFYDAQFTRPAGLVYSEYEDSYYDPATHSGGCLVRPFSIPPSWLRCVGCDFGASLNNAQVWAAEEPGTDRYYIYRVNSQIDATGPEQARAAAAYREPVRIAYGGARSETERRREWAIAGFPVAEPQISDVEAQIDRVNGLFKARRLFVFDSLTELRADLRTCSRELDDAGEPLLKIADKVRWHRLDALRYLTSAYPLDPRPVASVDIVPDVTRTVEGIRKQYEAYMPVETEEYL